MPPVRRKPSTGQIYVTLEDISELFQISREETSELTTSVRRIMKESLDANLSFTQQTPEALKSFNAKIAKKFEDSLREDEEQKLRMIDNYLKKAFGSWRHAVAHQMDPKPQKSPITPKIYKGEQTPPTTQSSLLSPLATPPYYSLTDSTVAEYETPLRLDSPRAVLSWSKSRPSSTSRSLSWRSGTPLRRVPSPTPSTSQITTDQSPRHPFEHQFRPSSSSIVSDRAFDSQSTAPSSSISQTPQRPNARPTFRTLSQAMPLEQQQHDSSAEPTASQESTADEPKTEILSRYSNTNELKTQGILFFLNECELPMEEYLPGFLAAGCSSLQHLQIISRWSPAEVDEFLKTGPGFAKGSISLMDLFVLRRGIYKFFKKYC